MVLGNVSKTRETSMSFRMFKTLNSCTIFALCWTTLPQGDIQWDPQSLPQLPCLPSLDCCQRWKGLFSNISVSVIKFVKYSPGFYSLKQIECGNLPSLNIFSFWPLPGVSFSVGMFIASLLTALVTYLCIPTAILICIFKKSVILLEIRTVFTF